MKLASAMLTIAAINQENINYDDISSSALLLEQIKQIGDVVEEVRQNQIILTKKKTKFVMHKQEHTLHIEILN